MRRTTIALCCLIVLVLLLVSCGGSGSKAVSQARTTLGSLNNINQLTHSRCSDLFTTRLIRTQFKTNAACDKRLAFVAAFAGSVSSPTVIHKAELSSAEQRLVIAYKAAKAAAVTAPGGNFPVGEALIKNLKQYEPELKYALGGSKSASHTGLIVVSSSMT